MRYERGHALGIAPFLSSTEAAFACPKDSAEAPAELRDVDGLLLVEVLLSRG